MIRLVSVHIDDDQVLEVDKKAKRVGQLKIFVLIVVTAIVWEVWVVEKVYQNEIEIFKESWILIVVV